MGVLEKLEGNADRHLLVALAVDQADPAIDADLVANGVVGKLIVSKGVDLATTSQSEADEKRGRELRKQDEERGREARRMADRCRKGRALPTDDCTMVQPR